MLRWRRLTLLALGSLPPLILLEDAEDLCAYQVALERTVPPWRWVDELIAKAQNAAIEGLF
jgi:hypothetical protein